MRPSTQVLHSRDGREHAFSPQRVKNWRKLKGDSHRQIFRPRTLTNIYNKYPILLKLAHEKSISSFLPLSSLPLSLSFTSMTTANRNPNKTQLSPCLPPTPRVIIKITKPGEGKTMSTHSTPPQAQGFPSLRPSHASFPPKRNLILCAKDPPQNPIRCRHEPEDLREIRHFSKSNLSIFKQNRTSPAKN